jgi:nucleoside-diphosphate-sugar epimerase
LEGIDKPVKILVTGHDGYIGRVMVPMLQEAGHYVVGLDSFLFEGCTFGAEPARTVPAIRSDLRDVTPSDLRGFGAVVHLAGISSDRVADLNPSSTFAINYEASVRLARLSKIAGVARFLFPSSCSVYGEAGDGEILTEHSPLTPVSAYEASKAMVELNVSSLADDNFSPTYIRSPTVYGVSPRLRADLVVNNLVGLAHAARKIIINGDGSPWRSFVHVEDLGRAFMAVLHAPRELVHDEAFNVGPIEGNHRVGEVAKMVADAFPECRIIYVEGLTPNKCSSRVDFGKLKRRLPEFQPRWTVGTGIDQLVTAFRATGMSLEEFLGPRFVRINRILELMEQGRLDSTVRWRSPTLAGAAGRTT